MSATLLFAATDRDKAHEALGRVDRNAHPAAECREYPNDEKPYQVWSGPVDRPAEVAADTRAAEPEFTPQELQRLKKLLTMMESTEA